MISKKTYIDVHELAEYLHIGINGAYALCKQPDFPSLRIGKRILIDFDELQNTWIPNKKRTSLWR